MIDQLLSELDVLWNASEDPRFKGENPGCDRIQEEIAKIFQKMDDNKISKVLDNMPQEQIEQVIFILEGMAETRPFVNKYLFDVS